MKNMTRVKRDKISLVSQFALLMLDHGICIDTESHRKTPPGYLRNGDPSVCSHFFQTEGSHKDVLLYYPLKTYLKYKDSIVLYTDHPGCIRVEICLSSQTVNQKKDKSNELQRFESDDH